MSTPWPLARPVMQVFLWLIFTLTGLSHSAAAQSHPSIRQQTLSIPTARPTGIRRNDRIWITLFEPADPSVAPRPGVVLLHPLGEWRNVLMLDFGRFLAKRGMVAAVVELPFHMRRLPRGENPLRHYVSSDVEKVHRAFSQAIADASAVGEWLAKQPGVDADRIAAIGVSLGAIVMHTAMGKDSRFSAGVGILGGADFPDLYRRSALFRILYPTLTRELTEYERTRLREIDPLTYAGRNRPRSVLMIQAARDDIIPAGNAEHLWRELGQPEIRWLDTNHFGPVFVADPIREMSLDFLLREWGIAAERKLRPIQVPTIKLAMISGLDAPATLGLEFQLVSFYQRPNHMSLLHFDVGLDMRGPYFGFAATVNAYLDVGYGRRFGRARWRPYLSLHLAL